MLQSQFLPPSYSPWVWPWKYHRVARPWQGRAHPLLRTPVLPSRGDPYQGLQNSWPNFIHSWQMTNVAEHASIKYISGVNDDMRDVKSAIFNKDAPHQKYTIQSNSLSWAKRNKSLCVSILDSPLKGSRLVRKNGRASYFICVVYLLLYSIQ